MSQTGQTIGTLEDLGSVIRRRRRASSLTIDQAADLLGVSRRFLIELENGKRRASVDTVLRVLQALGLDLRVSPRSATDWSGRSGNWSERSTSGADQ